MRPPRPVVSWYISLSSSHLHTLTDACWHAHRCSADGLWGLWWWKEIIGEEDRRMNANIIEANAWDKHTWAHAGNRLRWSDFHPLSNWHPKTVTSPNVPLWDGKIDIRRARDRRTRLEQEISKEMRQSCCFVQFSPFNVSQLNALEVFQNSLSSLSFSSSLYRHAGYPDSFTPDFFLSTKHSSTAQL